MPTSSLPDESGNNNSVTTNDEAAELLADRTHLQALEDGELARTVKLRAGVLERQVTEGDNEFALTMIQSIRRALREVEHRARTGAPSRVADHSEERSNAPTAVELMGEFCLACKSTEAWHPCITEDDSTKFACDECGASMAIRPAPKPKPAKAKRRRFEFVVEFERGILYVDINDFPLIAFERGKGLEFGRLAITTTSAIADSEDREFHRGFAGGQEAARRKAEESAA